VRREASGLGAKEKEGPRSFLEKGGEGTKLKAQNPHDLTSQLSPEMQAYQERDQYEDT